MKCIYIVIYLVSLIFVPACASSLTTASNKYVENNNVSSLNQFQKAFLIAVNKVRSKARMCGRKYFSAAPALSLNINLNKVAYEHSLDMYENQFLEHVSSNGDTLVQRMQDANYSWSAVAENIAHNQKNITQVIEDVVK